MKKNETPGLTLTTVLKVMSEAFHSLFFSSSNRDFQRLKNFIAS
jgi:hypothetical protein